MSDELKPCPFCGSKAVATDRVGGWTIDCLGPFDEQISWPCAALDGEMAETQEEAVRNWNTRPIEDAFKARAEKAEAAAAKLAKDALLRLMEDFSEDAYCAGWMTGTENACMDIVSGKINGWGMVSADRYREQLTELHDLCGGWWVWDEEVGDTVFKLDAEIERPQ